MDKTRPDISHWEKVATDWQQNERACWRFTQVNIRALALLLQKTHDEAAIIPDRATCIKATG